MNNLENDPWKIPSTEDLIKKWGIKHDDFQSKIASSSKSKEQLIFLRNEVELAKEGLTESGRDDLLKLCDRFIGDINRLKNRSF